MGLTVGVDIGGTKIASGVVDESGQIIDDDQVATPDPVDDDDTASSIEKAIAGLVSATSLGIPTWRRWASARPGSSTRRGRW